jgi:hypothetical protein
LVFFVDCVLIDLTSKQLEMKRIASDMIKQYPARSPWITLILCLCLCSLVISPPLFVAGMSMPDIYGIDFDNSSGFDASEFDDDLSVLPVVDLTIADMIFSRFGSTNLDFQSPFLLPDSPPPK